MKLVLTDKPSGREIIVDSDAIKLMEPDADGTGTHLVLSADLGRVVVESLPSIAALVGVIAPKSVAAVTAAEVAVKKKKV